MGISCFYEMIKILIASDQFLVNKSTSKSILVISTLIVQ